MTSSPHIYTNAERARRAGQALRAYRDCTGDSGTSVDEDVIDMLCDLRHYCDRLDLDFGHCDRIAYRNYLDELTEEKAGGR
mgnify:CR=1 FL=1|jgi:hypothetical protein